MTSALPSAGPDTQDHDRWFSTLNAATRTKLEALKPTIERAIGEAEEALAATDDDTNAELEANDILRDLRSALDFVQGLLDPEAT